MPWAHSRAPFLSAIRSRNKPTNTICAAGDAWELLLHRKFIARTINRRFSLRVHSRYMRADQISEHRRTRHKTTSFLSRKQIRHYWLLAVFTSFWNGTDAWGRVIHQEQTGTRSVGDRYRHSWVRNLGGRVLHRRLRRTLVMAQQHWSSG